MNKYTGTKFFQFTPEENDWCSEFYSDGNCLCSVRGTYEEVIEELLDMNPYKSRKLIITDELGTKPRYWVNEEGDSMRYGGDTMEAALSHYAKHNLKVKEGNKIF